MRGPAGGFLQLLGRYCSSHWARWGTITLLAQRFKHRGRVQMWHQQAQSREFLNVSSSRRTYTPGLSRSWSFCRGCSHLWYLGFGLVAWVVLKDRCICVMSWKVQRSWNDPPCKQGKLRELLSFLCNSWFFPVKTQVRSLLLKLTFLSLLNLLSHLPFLNMIDCSILKTATELFGSLRFWIVL